MNDPKSALVLGNKEENAFIKMLFKLGYMGITRSTTKESLHLIKHKRVQVIVIDLTFQKFDLLEFVLNVRDFDQFIPLVLIGTLPGDTATNLILRQPQVFYFDSFADSAIFKLNKILARSAQS